MKILALFAAFYSATAKENYVDRSGGTPAENIPVNQEDIQGEKEVDVNEFLARGEKPQVTISNIHPAHGPMGGSTRVTVRGGPFNGLMKAYPDPKCRFGSDDMVVGANYISCTEAPRKSYEKEAVKAERTSTCLQCENAPASPESKPVSFSVSLDGNFDDVTSSVEYYYYKDPKITGMKPRHGSKDGDTFVQVWGENFIDFGEEVNCSFGVKSTPAIVQDKNYITCRSPPSDVVGRGMPFSISLNGQQQSADRLEFWFYNDPQVVQVVPDLGRLSGGENLTIKGEGFKPFDVDEGELDISNSTFCIFFFEKCPPTQEEGCRNVTKRAWIKDGTTAYCQASHSLYDKMEAAVEITINARQRSDDETMYHYYKPHFLFDSQPRQGPTSGGTNVTVIGSNFTDTGEISCKFGKKNATFVKYKSSSEIICTSPEVPNPGYVELTIALRPGLDSEPVQFYYYNNPEVTGISPTSGPDYGFTQIAVQGNNFADLGGDSAVCVFNKTVTTNATVMSQNLLYCDSPSMINKQGYSEVPENDLAFYNVEVSIDGGRETSGGFAKFSYYREPELLEIDPPLGPVAGGTKVTIKGKGFLQKAALLHQVRLGHQVVEGEVNAGDGTISFTAPQVPVESTAPVSVSMNGQQFTQQLEVHDFKQELTYDYYDLPYVSFLSPMRGPTNGGTPITVEGERFLLNRPHLKDSLFVRFVDSSANVLSAVKSLPKSDFTYEHFFMKAPAVASEGTTLIQMSLNNQDWHDVKSPTGDSFSYYAAPHVTTISPSFGHVKAEIEQETILSGTGFLCTDSSCKELKCRFGNEDGRYIYSQAEFVSSESIKCKVPRYTKPDVLKVEVTVNDESYTNDNKTYGFYDPFVTDANPKLLAVDGSTKVNIVGIGFVNSGETRAQYSNRTEPLSCGDSGSCIKDATFIDKNTMQTTTFPQAQVKYSSNGNPVKWDPIHIDATVIGDEFGQEQINLWYYDDPTVVSVNVAESPANLQAQILVAMDFKENDMKLIQLHGHFKCRFRANNKESVSDGYLIAYPLSNSKNPQDMDTIHCKSPYWNLDDLNTDEVGSIEISINGQNFVQGKQFTFLKPLQLHRDVPMSGPQKVDTEVKLIGSGFHIPNGAADFKWGVQSSHNISTISEYSYSEDGFLNMIKGNRALFAYSSEASRFERVDSRMVEGDSYDLSTEVTRVNDMQGQREGPAYIEVGRTMRWERKASEDRAADSITTYNFQPSAVEMYTYKDFMVKEIYPRAGLSKGGTKVSVIGAWFKYMPEYGVVPHCKFGDLIVRAQFDSSVRLICDSPSSDEVGAAVPFSVSLNGVDWDSGNGLTYSYFEEPILSHIFPDMGPTTGGQEIFVVGEKFTNITDKENFKCKFTPISLPIPPKITKAHFRNSTHIQCTSPGGWAEADKVYLQLTWNGVDYDSNMFEYSFYSVHRAMPRSGPANGQGGDILIQGEGFRADANPKCKLNNTIYEPVSITDKEIRCPMVAAEGGDETYANVNLEVNVNGLHWEPFEDGFQYYEQPVVTSIDPKMGPNEGIGIINFYGSGFRDDYPQVALDCKVGESTGEAHFKSSRQIQCIVEDLPLVTEDEDALPAQVSLNSYSYTEVTENTYFRPYGVQMIEPNSGPMPGGMTYVVVQGEGFVSEDNVTPRCRFGTSADYAIVEAEILSYSRLACRTPDSLGSTPTSALPRDVPFSIALSGDEFAPWTQSSHKFRFYAQPKLQATDVEEVNIGNLLPVYITATEDDEFDEPMTPSHKLELNNRVSVSEVEEEQSTPTVIKCRFGRFGESSAVRINDTTVMCTSPATDIEPDEVYRETVNVAVAMNGVDFMESDDSPEFTFVGTAPYISFAAILLILLAVGFVLFAGWNLVSNRAQFNAIQPVQDYRPQNYAFPNERANDQLLRERAQANGP